MGKFGEILYEQKVEKEADRKLKKEIKQKILPELHSLDMEIEGFIEKLEEKINEITDNPNFVRKAHQLLANMSKEHSEFILALRAVVNALDRKGQVIPQIDLKSQVRDINALEDKEEK
jgi:sensor domain CHASE-containing protein